MAQATLAGPEVDNAATDYEVESPKFLDRFRQKAGGEEAIHRVFEGVVLQQHQLIGAHGQGLFHHVQSEAGAAGYDGYTDFLGIFDF